MPLVEGHPSERALGRLQVRHAPAQPGLALGLAAVRVALADLLDGVRVQVEFLAAACRELLQVLPRQPLAMPFDGLLLRLVAVVPDEGDCPRLPAQFAVCAVAQAELVGQLHFWLAMYCLTTASGARPTVATK